MTCSPSRASRPVPRQTANGWTWIGLAPRHSTSSAWASRGWSSRATSSPGSPSAPIPGRWPGSSGILPRTRSSTHPARRSAGASFRLTARPRFGWRTPVPGSHARTSPTSSSASIEATRPGIGKPAGRGWASPSPDRSSRSITVTSKRRASREKARPSPPGCRWRPNLTLESHDSRDFDGNAERQLAGAQRLPGVPAPLAEDLVNQVGCAVEHLRLLLEARGRADEAAELDELLHLIKRAGMLSDQRHDVQSADFRGTGAVLQAHVAPHHAAKLDLAVPARNDPRGVQQLTNLLNWNVGRQRLRRFWKLQAERAQRCLWR